MRRLILLTTLCLCLARTAAAQPPSGQAQGILPLTPQRSYNGIVAGEEAYWANDARRTAEIGRQVNLNADMYWRWSGASSWYPGVFEAWPVVPGEIVGWPAGVSPPRVSPTNVARRPIGAWAAAPVGDLKPAPVVIAPGAKPAPGVAAGDTNPSPGLLPGFVPQPEPSADVSKPDNSGGSAVPRGGNLSQPESGPRSF
jgi:hypothetical protein